MKIVHFEAGPEDQNLRNSPGNTVECVTEILTVENAGKAADAEVVTVFVNSLVDKATIDALGAAKLLVTRSTGFDHVDVAYANYKGITVCNVPGYGSRTVAEYAFALMLNLSRKVYWAIHRIKTSNSWDISDFEGFNLYGKTLGVVGTGRIGQNVIQIAKGFGMEVIANDAFPNEAKAKELDFRYVDLNTLLSTSDIVTLHVPATPETHHLITKTNIKLFKKGALIINTARGDVVDPDALLYGLSEGIIGGAALDVLEGEHELKEEAELLSKEHPANDKLKILLEDHILFKYPNVIVTPHIAFDTVEARQEIISTTLENIEKFQSGNPQNVIKA